MVDMKKLEEMERISREAAPAALADLQDVKITGETPAQRLESYLAQTEPYRFRVGPTPVRVSFQSETSPLSEKLKSYFLSLKGGDFI